MQDQDKTREQLVSENEELRRRVATMESSEAERSRQRKTYATAKPSGVRWPKTPRSSWLSLTNRARCSS